MRQSARILFNATVMFGRMALTFGVGLYATRVLVNVLGHSDFGVLATLGASGTLLVFVGRGLNASAQRNLAHELGGEDPDRLREVFHATLVLFSLMSALVLLVGVLVEPLVVRAIQIPPGREEAASRVFLLTLSNLVAITATTPFRAVVNARQAMGQVAAFELLRSLLSLAAVLLLFVVEGDALVLYATFLLVASLLRSLAMAGLCAVRFPESRPRLARVPASELSRVARFAGWATLINVGSQFYNQAAIVLLGLAFSPVVTAAYAIAMRAGGYHNNFARVLPRVVQPAMTTLEARGRRDDVQALALLTSRYACLGVLFFVVPILLEAEGILRLWLDDYPPQTPLFVRLAMAWLTVQVASSGFDRAVYAHGSIASYAIRTTSLWIATLLLAAFWLFVLDAPAWTLPATILGSTLAQIPLRVGYVGKLIGLGYRVWARETLARVFAPACVGTAAAWLVHVSLADDWPRYLATLAAYGAASLPAIWLFAVGEREKRALREAAVKAVRRLRPVSG